MSYPQSFRCRGIWQVAALTVGIVYPVTAGSFFGIGQLPNPAGSPGSTATGISGDGSIVIGMSATTSNHGSGSSTGSLVRWTMSGGLENLGVDALGSGPPILGPVISQDGSTIGGTFLFNFQGFRWTDAGGFQPIPNSFVVNGISADGSAITATRIDLPNPDRAGIYRAATGFQFEDMGVGDPIIRSWAGAMSPSGTAAGGHHDLPNSEDIYRWREGIGAELIIAGMDDLPENPVTGISDDGSIVVGRSFRWTEDSGLESFLGQIDIHGMSDDTSILFGDTSNQASIVDSAGSVRLVRDILLDDFGISLNGWNLRVVHDVSSDGTVLVGSGTNPSGRQEGWVAIIPEPSTLFCTCASAAILALRRRRS